VEVAYTFSITSITTLILKLWRGLKMNDKITAIITSFGGAFGVEDNSSSYVVISGVGMF
jgi:hypothetical protein